MFIYVFSWKLKKKNKQAMRLYLLNFFKVYMWGRGGCLGWGWGCSSAFSTEPPGGGESCRVSAALDSQVRDTAVTRRLTPEAPGHCSWSCCSPGPVTMTPCTGGMYVLATHPQVLKEQFLHTVHIISWKTPKYLYAKDLATSGWCYWEVVEPTGGNA
jgi:hypothetical protein